MRGYAIASTSVFALIVGAHVARLVAEGTGPLTDPMFMAASGFALAMTVWGAVALRRGQ